MGSYGIPFTELSVVGFYVPLVILECVINSLKDQRTSL